MPKKPNRSNKAPTPFRLKDLRRVFHRWSRTGDSIHLGKLNRDQANLAMAEERAWDLYRSETLKSIDGLVGKHGPDTLVMDLIRGNSQGEGEQGDPLLQLLKDLMNQAMDKSDLPTSPPQPDAEGSPSKSEGSAGDGGGSEGGGESADKGEQCPDDATSQGTANGVQGDATGDADGQPGPADNPSPASGKPEGRGQSSSGSSRPTDPTSDQAHEGEGSHGDPTQHECSPQRKCHQHERSPEHECRYCKEKERLSETRSVQCTTAGADKPEVDPMAEARAMARRMADQGSHASGDAEGGSAGLDEKILEKLEVESETQEASSLHSRTHDGGMCMNHSIVEDYMKQADRKAVKEVRKYLEKLVDTTVAAGFEQSPRVDPKRLVKHLVSKRGQIQRCFREELERANVIIGSDVSGSCSAVCNSTTAAALSLARDDDRVWVVIHSNGHIKWIYHQSQGQFSPDHRGINNRELRIRRRDEYGDEHLEYLGWWGEILQEKHVAAMVAFGDHDAEWTYRAISESGADLFWLHSLDSTDKCYVSKPEPMPLEFYPQGWSRDPVAFWRGVKDVKTACIAFRGIMKELRAEWKTRNDQWRTQVRKGWKTGCGRQGDQRV